MPVRMFAFGANTVGSCKCPALAAGVDPFHLESFVAEYDSQAAFETDIPYEGLISETLARDAWIDTMKHYKNQEILAHEVELAMRVAVRLGWLETGDEL